MDDTNERWYVVNVEGTNALANDEWLTYIANTCHKASAYAIRAFTSYGSADCAMHECIADDELRVVDGITFDALVAMEKARHAIDDA